MSVYVKGSNARFSMDTFCSMIGHSVSDGPSSKTVYLAHKDAEDEVGVGSFPQFKRIYIENGLKSTGNRVFEDDEAVRMMNRWKKQNPNILDLPSIYGCQSFTQVALILTQKKMFTVDSVLKFSLNPENMEKLLEMNGLKRKKQDYKGLTDTATPGAFEPKKQKMSESPTPGSFNPLKGLAMSTPIPGIKSEKVDTSIFNKFKSYSSEEAKKLERCFDSSDNEGEGIAKEKGACKSLVFKKEKEDDKKEHDVIQLDDDESAEESMDNWREKFVLVESYARKIERELASKTDRLSQAEQKIASLQMEMSVKEEKAKAKYNDLEDKMKDKIAKYEDQIASIIEVKSDGSEPGQDEKDDDIRVSKASFEKLIANVAKINAVVSDLPDKKHLENATNFLNQSFKDKMSQMKDEVKEIFGLTKTDE